MKPRRGRLRLAYDAGRKRPARSFPCSTNPYGLTMRELRHEIRRLTARGWQLWEIRRRLCPCKNSEYIE
ncbi:hypothetical protein O3Q52_19300 [Streptomyces sp. ActVer]|uniref:hypothetical protein n=1 Tax=Streptomyces sp. ActVer TaxID=3014558 RepID=UPI0022B3787C|nr:hypothetical protein [Streptomyces sp. ActVer]MCZ4510297.1 hypothetical protein [Streptomyces sp. ActVer]